MGKQENKKTIKQKSKENNNINSKKFDFAEFWRKYFVRYFGWSWRKEKEYLVENLAMLLTSGMDITLALKAIQSEMKSAFLKKVLQEVNDDITNGSPIWEAMRKSQLFPEYVIALIRVGEESGQLNEKLKVVSEQEKRQRVLKSRITAALSYPVLIILLTLVVGVAISTFVLPRFVMLFGQIDKELPVATKGLIWLSSFLVNNGVWAVPMFFVLLALTVFFVFMFPKTKFMGQWLFFHLPVTKNLVQEIEIARFGSNLGTLLKAGLPVGDALEALIRSVSFYNYKKFYSFIKSHVMDGDTFLQAFNSYPRSHKLLPLSIQQMIGSSEQSSFLAESLMGLAEVYEVKTDITAKNLTTLLEPVLLIFIGLAVLGVALAIILPIYGLINNL